MRKVFPQLAESEPKPATSFSDVGAPGLEKRKSSICRIENFYYTHILTICVRVCVSPLLSLDLFLPPSLSLSFSLSLLFFTHIIIQVLNTQKPLRVLFSLFLSSNRLHSLSFRIPDQLLSSGLRVRDDCRPSSDRQYDILQCLCKPPVLHHL